MIALCLEEVLGAKRGIDGSTVDFLGASAMKYGSALGLSLCGASIFALTLNARSGVATLSVRIMGIIVVAIGLLALTDDLLGTGFGANLILYGAPGVTEGDFQAGPISAASAYCFVLVGLAVVVASLSMRARYRVPVYAAFAITVIVVGSTNFAGHLAESPGNFSWWSGAGISIPASIGFALSGAGLLALAVDEGGLKWSLSSRVAAGFLIGVLLMVAVTATAFDYTVLLLDSSEWVSHTQQVLKYVERCRSDLASLAGNQQRFLATGDEQFLVQQDRLVNEMSEGVRSMARLTQDNAVQRERLGRLALLVTEHLKLGSDVVEARRLGLAPAKRLVPEESNLLLQEDVANLLRDVGDEEFRLLGARQRRSSEASRMTLVLLPLGVLVSLTILSVGLLTLNSSYNERKLAEANLRKLAAIVESSDDGMIGKDLNGVVTSWNKGARSLFGYSANEMVGQSIMKLIPPDRRDEETQILARIGHGEFVMHFETVRLRKDGTNIDVSVTVSPIKDRTGRIIGASKVVRDITERKKAEAKILELNATLEERVRERTVQLEAANKELEAFSYSVSHDMRAPLRAIDGFSQAVLEDYKEQMPAEGRRYLAIIREGAQRMGALIDDLLTFSRLSRMPVSNQPVDMAELVADALDELGVKEGDPKVQVRLGHLPPCQGDRALLKQVWLNLLSNALKYSRNRDTSVVEIGCGTQDGKQVYVVKDNGTGFDMLYANKLFGVFQRLHRSDEYEGTGVGLAIVQRVIHRHGGSVWAEAALDKGATFFFTVGDERANG
jgi:PAS domain S-box-containing protein